MNIVDIIEKKKSGNKLSREEIEYFITGYTKGNIPDYQASALLMAICFIGMDREETFQLTSSMRYSGDTVELSAINGIKVDKHSTGGVGDKTTLVVGPLAAACGVPVAKMSGRGLGFTGGTVDKLESIPGFLTTLEEKDFIELVNKIGLSVIGQTSHIAPADKKLYALRDVTATVNNISLIASSIMSKKLASGSDAIVLDVKCGNGAFMENLDQAYELGKLLVEIGTDAGKKTIAVITDMSQPLGKAIGNSNEVIEAIETLKGRGPEDITELALTLAGMMIFAGAKAESPEEGKEKARNALQTGAALEKFASFIEGQRGNSKVVNDYSLFPQPIYSMDVVAPKRFVMTSGCISCGNIKAKQGQFVTEISARAIGLASQHSGAGRTSKEDTIDLSAGVYLKKKIGDAVLPGEILAVVYGNDLQKIKMGAAEAEKAFKIGVEPPVVPVLIKKVII